MHSTFDTQAFNEFLKPGIEASDVDALFPLLQSAHIIEVLIAFFRGGREEVMIRLAVMREIAARADQPEWTPAQLQNHLSFIDATKLETVLNRLKTHDLLQWDTERRVYQISAAGRMVLSAIAGLIKFGQEDDELGFLLAQAAGGSAVGSLDTEHLNHVLAKLTEYEHFFETAVTSGSEFRLRAAQVRLAKAMPWVEKATQIIRSVGEQGLNDASAQVVHRIARQQSRLLQMASTFQLELAKIARQRVVLSQSGLSSTELSAWLQLQTVENLASLAHDTAQFCESLLLLPDVMTDIAEDVIEREVATKKVSVMPDEVEICAAQTEPFEYPPQLAALTQLLGDLTENAKLEDVIIGGSFSEASYRYSLLTFLGEQHEDADLAALASQPYLLKHNLDAPLLEVHRQGVARMTEGLLEKTTDKVMYKNQRNRKENT